MNRQLLFVDSEHKWTPPDGLDGSRPRPVSLTGGGKALLALALALVAGAVAAGAGLETVAKRDAEERRLFREQGADTDGVVSRLWRTKGESGRTWIAYQFTFGGRWYERQAKIPRSVWRNLRVGAPIPVRYVPSNPELNYPRDSQRKGMPESLPYLVAAALAICGGLVTLPILSQRRLLATGRVAPGRVTAHSAEHHGMHGAKLGKQFYYDFVVLSGAMRKGASGPTKNPPAIGSRICVLYDPENPRSNAVYPLSLVRPVHHQ